MAAALGKEPFTTLGWPDDQRRINGTKNTGVLNTCTGPLIEGTFACGEPV